MCRSFRATGHSCGLRSKDSISVQRPALRAVPIASCLHESSGGSPCSLERTGRVHPQIHRSQAHTGLVSGSVMRTQGFGSLAPQPVGLRVNWEKSKLSPMQRISFLGMELDSVNQTAHLTQEWAQLVLNCLNTFKSRTAAPLKQFQRLLGHISGCGGSHAAGAAPYETA